MCRDVSDAFAVLSGLLNAVQSGCSPMLGRSVGQMPAAMIGLVPGQLAWPSADQPAGAPWRAWAGSVLRVTFILSQLFVAGQVGSGVFVALTVTATVTMPLVLFHHGLTGADGRSASWGRISGALVMFARLGLIAKF